MVGYSFEHGFNDTFTLRQNLRFAENKTAQNSVYGYGVCSDKPMVLTLAVVRYPQSDKGHI
jgi:iron complex outermembrane receptor protein